MKFTIFKEGLTLKTASILGVIIVLFTVLVIAIKLLFSLAVVEKSAETIKSESATSITELEGWNNQGIKDQWKEKIWLENQLALGKQDSMSLGINFTDSIIQLQFKGLALVESKIRYKVPIDFLKGIDSKMYVRFFGSPDTIISAYSNVAKKPVKKVRVDSEGNTVPVDTSATVNKVFYWEFVTANNISFVFNGYDAYNDSVDTTPVFNRDIRKYRTGKKTIARAGNVYTPVVFIWLDNDEAKAIYRALPYKANIITKN